MEKTLQVNPNNPDPGLIKKAASLINAQGLVVFPTQGLYGLAANALDPKAIQKVFSAKQRPESNPLLVLIHQLEQLDSLIPHIPEQAKLLMGKFWPGDLTIVCQARNDLPGSLLGNTQKIGIRMPAHPVALALARSAGCPITGTSANISGTPPCTSIKDLSPKLAMQTDIILDAGKLAARGCSTVVDVTCHPPKIIRQGRINPREILITIT